jgi:hypothetical protein
VSENTLINPYSAEGYFNLKRTADAVKAQIWAMGSEVFEVGLFDPAAPKGRPVMILRTWDADTVMRSVPWLAYENRNGRNIYIRPAGEHDLSLVDDLKAENLHAMKRAGFAPALVVETSPGNYQAWLKHHQPLTKELGTAAARELAREFGGDIGAADWRHFGRLSGATNRKIKHFHADTGHYPFVLLREASGLIYPESKRFIAVVEGNVQWQKAERERLRAAYQNKPDQERQLKSIESFRSDPRYGGDGTRIDLAYAIYALNHDLAPEAVGAALRSRDLSHKGNERRQEDYVERTIRKALGTVHGIGHGGR